MFRVCAVQKCGCDCDLLGRNATLQPANDMKRLVRTAYRNVPDCAFYVLLTVHPGATVG